MVIQHNIPALNAHRNMGLNNSGINKNLEKLSSGFRINRAADDAAGLAISEKMRGQIKGLAMAEQNTSHGINLIQTAEGGLNETHSILQRMRELAVQASNGTYQEDDLQQLTLEFEALKSEIDRIAESTHYNGIKLLNGRLDDTLYAQRMQDANDILKNATFGVNAAAGDEFLIEVAATAVTAATTAPIPTSTTVSYDMTGLLANGAVANDKLDITVDGTTKQITFAAAATRDEVLDAIVKEINDNIASGYTASVENGAIVFTNDTAGASTSWTSPVLALAGDAGNGGTGLPNNTITLTAAKREEGLSADSHSVIEWDLTGITAGVVANKAVTFSIGSENFSLTSGGSTNTATLLATDILAHLQTTAAEQQLKDLGIELDTAASTGGKIVFKAIDAGTNAAVDNLTISPIAIASATLTGAPTESRTAGVTLRTQNVPASVDTNQITISTNNGTAATVLKGFHDVKTNTVYFEDADGNQFTIDANRLKAGEAMSAQVRAAEGDNLVFQIGANGGSDQRVYLAVTDMSSFTLGLYAGDIKSNGIEATTAEELLLSRANITSIADANIAIDVITAATNQVSSQRAELGALQNRLESAMNSLGITKENLTAAESTIRDVDMAKEMMDFTKNSILVQASQAMLAQANQLPQGVLQLLR